jgi:hypothetical protein
MALQLHPFLPPDLGKGKSHGLYLVMELRIFLEDDKGIAFGVLKKALSLNSGRDFPFPG